MRLSPYPMRSNTISRFHWVNLWDTQLASQIAWCGKTSAHWMTRNARSVMNVAVVWDSRGLDLSNPSSVSVLRMDWREGRQEQKGLTEDEMVEWDHRLDAHEFEQAPGVGDGQGSLVCYSLWGWTWLSDWMELKGREGQKQKQRATPGAGVLVGHFNKRRWDNPGERW